MPGSWHVPIQDVITWGDWTNALTGLIAFRSKYPQIDTWCQIFKRNGMVLEKQVGDAFFVNIRKYHSLLAGAS